MDTRRLQHAVAVGREGSFAAAAAALPMSQSALTRSIQALEKQYGLTIFERGRNGVQLTADGAKFIASAEEILHATARAEERLAHIAAGNGDVVRVGAGPLLMANLLPRVLPRLTELPFRFEIRIGSSRGLRASLRRGEIDFYLGGMFAQAERAFSSSGLEIDPILPASDKLRLTVRAGHPLAGSGYAKEALHSYPVACESFINDQLGPSGFELVGLQRPTVEVDDYRALTDLVAVTDFILVSPWNADLLREDGELSTGFIDAPPMIQEWHWGFVSSSRIPLSLASSTVRDFIRSEVLSDFVRDEAERGR